MSRLPEFPDQDQRVVPLSDETFIENYLRPAVKDLCERWESGTLDDTDREFLRAILPTAAEIHAVMQARNVSAFEAMELLMRTVT